MKLLKMSNFTFFHNVFYAICILKSFNSPISVVVSGSLNLGRSQNGVLRNGLRGGVTGDHSFMHGFILISPNTRRQILDYSKSKQSADYNFKFDENIRKFSKQLENTVGKEKLLVSSNFSFSHSVFKKLVSHGHQKMSLCWNGFMNSLRGSVTETTPSGMVSSRFKYDT